MTGRGEHDLPDRPHPGRWPGLQRLGCVSDLPTGRGQCFGFLPPLALGGDLDLDHVQKVGLQGHLHFLGELV
ncbi:T6SS immunity protein Tdi1 domain-containing protein [Deinococcus knuensis]|uniref:T6SS immunity protein Tdi1 domain-containing protein n=1 Tax=Deinococcus knuensis TaxID=1837380 RepID=UPI00166D3C96